MNMPPPLKFLIISLAFTTAAGILVHDTKFDKAVTLALPVVAVTFSAGAHIIGLDGASSHTHVERVSFAANFKGMARVQPRDDHRRCTLPKYISGRTQFNGANHVLWPSV